RKKRRISPALCLKVLNDLEKERCIVRIENGVWQMTRTGIEKGYHIALKQRMYEVYLMHEMELANIEFDQDHFVPDRLPEETRERLFSLLKLYGRMPELRKAPPDAEKGQIANEF
ncbi:metal ABC transporter permease, partial [Bacillus inaquosorum]|nr:metal ABC transporter permease [Bacillus inaquosorum]